VFGESMLALMICAAVSLLLVATYGLAAGVKRLAAFAFGAYERRSRTACNRRGLVLLIISLVPLRYGASFSGTQAVFWATAIGLVLLLVSVLLLWAGRPGSNSCTHFKDELRSTGMWVVERARHIVAVYFYVVAALAWWVFRPEKAVYSMVAIVFLLGMLVGIHRHKLRMLAKYLDWRIRLIGQIPGWVVSRLRRQKVEQVIELEEHECMYHCRDGFMPGTNDICGDPHCMAGQFLNYLAEERRSQEG
jgi:hypothetical protein